MLLVDMFTEYDDILIQMWTNIVQKCFISIGSDDAVSFPLMPRDVDLMVDWTFYVKSAWSTGIILSIWAHHWLKDNGHNALF